MFKLRETSHHNSSILIVDDDKTSSLMLQKHLQRQGYDIICAFNGQEPSSYFLQEIIFSYEFETDTPARFLRSPDFSLLHLQ